MTAKSMSYDEDVAEIERQLRGYAGFSGSGEELLRLVERLASSLHLAPEDDSGNERLLRHYASVNVVDKPSRQGRDAVYTYRHLLQFLTARRLMKQGFALSKIAEFTSVVPTETLQQTLCESPQRSEAELLVAAYKAARVAPSAPPTPRSITRRPSATAASISSAPRPEPMYGMADVMHEIEKMRARFMSEIQDMQSQMRRSLHAVEKTSETLDRLQMDSVKNLRWVLEEKKESQQRLEERLMRLADMTAQSYERIRSVLGDATARSDRLEQRMIEMSDSIEKLRLECLGAAKKGNPV